MDGQDDATTSVDVPAWVNELQQKHGAAGVKQQLAAVRMMFDWLVTGQVVPMNPAAAVRGPKHVVKTGKTPVLDSAEWRRMIDSIPAGTLRDLRDRALIATLTYSFARIGAALKMKVEDVRPQGAGWEILLHEKGGKDHIMASHHELAVLLHQPARARPCVPLHARLSCRVAHSPRSRTYPVRR